MKKKNFWIGYGHNNLAEKIKIRQEQVPENFIIYRGKISRLITIGMFVALVIPIILNNQMFLNLFGELLKIVDINSKPISSSFFCSKEKFWPVFYAWRTIMSFLGVVVIVYGFARFPRNTLIIISRRIESGFVHFSAMMIGGLFSFLSLNIFFRNGKICEPSYLILGHGNIILQSITNSIFGLSILGPMLWGLFIVIWMSTLLLAGLGIVRIFNRN